MDANYCRHAHEPTGTHSRPPHTPTLALLRWRATSSERLKAGVAGHGSRSVSATGRRAVCSLRPIVDRRFERRVPVPRPTPSPPRFNSARPHHGIGQACP
jgi:hypothetical protein